MAVNRPPVREQQTAGPGAGPRGPKRQHRKVCTFCAEKMDYIDYKETSRLRRFVSDRGKILPRRVTGTCARHQRPLTTALERARHCAASVHDGAPLEENQQRRRNPECRGYGVP